MKKIKFILLIALAVVISACSSTVRFSSSGTAAQSNKIKVADGDDINHYDSGKLRHKLIIEAESWIGTPYRYGGESRSGADCSGFVMMVYSSIGYTLPRTSNDQYNKVKKIDFDDKEPGDLIFFENKNKIHHVGIYLGNGDMIHASSSRGIIKQSLSDYYFSEKIAGTGRVLK